MNRLLADALKNDPSVIAAKKQILEAVKKHQENLSTIRPAQTDLKVSYEKSVQLLGNLRGQELFFPYIGSGFGKGALVELADGSVKYDFISGVGTHWGHTDPELIAASLDASLQDICMESNLQYNQDAYELMRLLTQHSGMDHCFLTTSGAMANENALKIILQKKAPATRILSFERCFMGRTLALSQITDKPLYREGLPLTYFVDYLPYYDDLDPQGSTDKAVQALKKHLARYPKAHACMCFELIQGEGGNYSGTHEFFKTLMEILKKNEILIFVDEIQTFGRTDHLFAFQHFALADYVDIVSCGKLLHTCATLYKDSIRPKPWLIAQTFLSATSLIHAAHTILRKLLNDGYLGPNGKNRLFHLQLTNHLRRVAAKYPEKLEGPFGYGLMVACTPFKGDRDKVVALAKALFEAGLITFIAGSSPTRLRFLIPPGMITLEQIDHAAAIFEEILGKMP